MAIDRIAQRLGDLDIFHGLTPAQMERIAREAERIIFRDGQVMATAGTEADGAFVLISGQASVRADPASTTQIDAIETGSMIAEPAMLVEHEFGLTVVAEGEVRAIKITRDKLREWMLDDPSMTDHFVGRIATRLTRVAIELRLIDERLANAYVGQGSVVAGPGACGRAAGRIVAPDMAPA